MRAVSARAPSAAGVAQAPPRRAAGSGARAAIGGKAGGKGRGAVGPGERGEVRGGGAACSLELPWVSEAAPAGQLPAPLW